MFCLRRTIGYNNLHNCLRRCSTNVVKMPSYQWIKEKDYNTFILNPAARAELGKINLERYADSISNIKPELDYYELNDLVYIFELDIPTFGVFGGNEYFIKNNLYKIGLNGKRTKPTYRIIGGEFIKKWIEYKNFNLIMVPEQWVYNDNFAICKKIKREPNLLFTCDQIKQLISLMQYSGYVDANPDNIMYCDGKIAIIDTELTGFLQHKFPLSNTVIKNVEDWTMCALKHIIHVLKLLKNHSTDECQCFMRKRIHEYENFINDPEKSMTYIKKKFIEYEKNIHNNEINIHCHEIDSIIHLYLKSYNYDMSIRTIVTDDYLMASRHKSYCCGSQIGDSCPSSHGS